MIISQSVREQCADGVVGGIDVLGDMEASLGDIDVMTDGLESYGYQTGSRPAVARDDNLRFSARFHRLHKPGEV